VEQTSQSECLNVTSCRRVVKVSERIKGFVNKPVWSGGQTLHVGELITFTIALALIFWLGKVSIKSMWVWVALIALFIAMIVW